MFQFGRKPLLLGVCLLGAIVALGVGPGTDTGQTSASPQPLMFTRDIAPIIFEKCAPCHHPGGSAPFALLEYEDVRKRARQITLDTILRFMPPCNAVSDFGSFCDTRPISDDEIAAIQRWENFGAVEGDPKFLPAKPSFSDDWRLGRPDLVLTLPERYTVPEDGIAFWRAFVIPLGLDRVRTLRAFDIRPAAARTMRHVQVVQDIRGAFRLRERSDRLPGFETFGSLGVPEQVLGSWAPGYPPPAYPNGIGRRLRPGDDIVVQVQYHATGKPEDGGFELGLYFHDGDTHEEPQWLTLGSDTFEIPGGMRHLNVTDSYTLPVGARILSLHPEARFVCRDVTLRARFPGGEVKTLYYHDKWDPFWTGSYRFSAPPLLPRGTVLEVGFTYDNSDHNERLPFSPPRTARAGYGRFDELAWFHVEYVPAP